MEDTGKHFSRVRSSLKQGDTRDEVTGDVLQREADKVTITVISGVT